MLSDAEILKAWEDAFDKPVYFDHQPTASDILLVRIKAVLTVVKQAEKGAPDAKG